VPILTEAVDVAAPPERVWGLLVDWERQGGWMLLTRVRATAGGGSQVGDRIEAWTGVGRLGFTDQMTITEWDPPRRCVVRHDGRLVRGTGVFEVVDVGTGRAQLRWSERLELPLGWGGRLGWRVVRPLFRAGVVRSLRRFRALAEGSHD
jgi:hypothetical protein